MHSFWISLQGSLAEAFSSFVAALPLPAFWQLSLFSAVLGCILVWLYRFVSFQSYLSKLKKKIAAVALEPFLFSDSARVSVLSPLRLAGLSCRYLAVSIPPLLVLALPAIWALSFLNQSFGYDAVPQQGQVEVTVNGESAKDIRQLELNVLGKDFSVTPVVRAAREQTAWAGLRRVSSEGNSEISVSNGTEEVKVALEGPEAVPVLSALWWKRILYPGSKRKLPSGISDIEISFPARNYNIFGLQLPWIVVALIASMGAGFVFAKMCKIQL